MKLNNKTLRHYRSIGHNLNPVVIVAQDLTDNVHTEINRALSDHELIKIRIVTDNRESRKKVIDEICEKQNAEQIQVIGKTALIFRAAKKLKPHLSNIQRFNHAA
ncbi:MAG: YhbY family RNA-binding protein, partial [Pseudomonadales bacterium]